MKCECENLSLLKKLDSQFMDRYREHLEKIELDHETWDIIYQCSETKLFFIKSFPQSELHGVGPPE